MANNARFLMCPPTFFEVSYVINPWMQGNVAQADASDAAAQWDTLHEALASRAQVALIDAAPGLPDMPFAANAGVVYRDVFVPSRFRHEERRGEEAHFERWFDAAGFRLQAPPEGVYFEGAGDALLDRGAERLWMGHGHRSDLACADMLRDTLDIDVQPLRLVDPRFYHLDTCFCPLTGGYLMYFPGAFDADSLARIEARVPAQRRLAVAAEDALAFACNAVDVGDAVLINRSNPALARGLRAFGYEAVEVPLGEFMKSGGSAKCLTLRLDEAGHPGDAAETMPPLAKAANA